MTAVGQSRLARRRGDENLLPPMHCGTGKGQVAGCGVAPTTFSLSNGHSAKLPFTYGLKNVDFIKNNKIFTRQYQ
jgi:hypothetical protein